VPAGGPEPPPGSSRRDEPQYPRLGEVLPEVLHVARVNRLLREERLHVVPLVLAGKCLEAAEQRYFEQMVHPCSARTWSRC